MDRIQQILERLKASVSLRGGLWFVNLVLAGVVSYAAASLAMELLRNRLEAATMTPRVAVQRRDTAQPRRRMAQSEFQAVLDANLFKAERTQKRPPAGIPQVPALASPPPGLSLMLTGTMIAGRRSFAMVAGASGQNEKVYRVGECLPASEEHPVKECAPNQGRLTTVESGRILVAYQNREIEFKLEKKPRQTPKARPPRAARRPAKRPVAKPAAGGTMPFPAVQDGDNINVNVPSAEVNKAFENFSEVLKQARVVPYSGDDGSGFQIRSIRPGSIFQRIGLHNFDVIKSVNGQPITTADQAVGLLTKFRNEKEISMEILRRNKPFTLNYTIE